MAAIVLASGSGELALAGGSALIMHGIIDRDTQDVDAFAEGEGADTAALAADVTDALRAAGYTVTDVSPTPTSTLRKLIATRRRRVPVEVGISFDPRVRPTVPTRVGPAIDPIELGANKILALYSDPSRARDVDDLARLCTRYRFAEMLHLADTKQRTPVDREMLADSFGMLSTADQRLYPRGTDITAIRAFARGIALHLSRSEPLPVSPYPAGATAEDGLCSSTSTRSGHPCRRRSSNGHCHLHR
ncbi:nucleotidyl transferase AbiEii/AbiGii toxin family protein [Tsukamurella soli]|uniref:Nucleotidyl transferase AbiEii toxin, Type IV TA system n=1 Tax=Tsukamurella soli TaxID=644556 RepID=A0ABP8J6M8_9ACTN